MKKIVIIALIIFVLLLQNNEKNIVIPQESIRFRIIANSNSKEDQTLKFAIAKDLTTNTFTNLNNVKNIDDSRIQIKNSIPLIETTLNKYNTKYNINYGYNYFPNKTYKGIEYDSGNYESLVITLGDGSGENFWCVLFPPLCLLEGQTNDTSEVEYRSLIKDILDRF